MAVLPPRRIPVRRPPGRRSELPESRAALIRFYAATDPSLRAELAELGFVVPEQVDRAAELGRAARRAADELAPHPIRIAIATMQLLAESPPIDEGPLLPEDQLREVASTLMTPSGLDLDEGVESVMSALRTAAQQQPADRWNAFIAALEESPGPVDSGVGGPARADLQPAFRGARALLSEDLRPISTMSCHASFRYQQGEVVSRVEAQFVVEKQADLEVLALAVLPQNWPHCNDFFISLTPRPDLDPRCPGATGGPLLPSCQRWSGVFEERVGGRPDGWFPDTFLHFTWERRPQKIILRYQLVPPRGTERTVLRVDQGYIEVHQRQPDKYHVSTLKYLLFDDTFLPSGGQSMGQLACELGWLDYALTQFSGCAETIQMPSLDAAVAAGARPGTADSQIQQALDRCEGHLRESATEAQAQLQRARKNWRADNYGTDDFVGDWATLFTRGVRDGARSIQDWALIARGAAQIARDTLRIWEGPR